ncbi:uncharacterized protein LOC105428535 isoform X1 [Pogonomyrmex barbatus]|uniref:Uncharacterized protein LOC105428535 isoform X1 n=1 Tax=Pogonomyrmex barbatus TaxID=144034 RepID=A0A6I9WAC1_9HYME|nr:uncharacterized protein LOC105428535 isoform X1 [Pogonomyrmex barbatus]
MIMAKLSTGDVPRTTKLFTYTLVQLQRVFAKVFALDELNLPVVGTKKIGELSNHSIIILSGNCHIRVLSRQCSNRGNKSKMQHWKWISDTTAAIFFRLLDRPRK